jgi:hypothetical protein
LIHSVGGEFFHSRPVDLPASGLTEEVKTPFHLLPGGMEVSEKLIILDYHSAMN